MWVGELKCPHSPGGCDQGGDLGSLSWLRMGAAPLNPPASSQQVLGAIPKQTQTQGTSQCSHPSPFLGTGSGKGNVCSILGFLCSGKLLHLHRVSAAILRSLSSPAIPRGSSLSSGIENNTLLLHFAELLCFI